MRRSGRALWGLLGLVVATVVAAGPALAGDDDPERQARRHELRQQLQAERERWRADGRGPAGGYGIPPGSGYRSYPGFGAAPGHPGPPGYARPGQGYAQPGRGERPGDAPPAYAPGVQPGGPPGWSGGHRLSPDERRALREELRQRRP